MDIASVCEAASLEIPPLRAFRNHIQMGLTVGRQRLHAANPLVQGCQRFRFYASDVMDMDFNLRCNASGGGGGGGGTAFATSCTNV